MMTLMSAARTTLYNVRMLQIIDKHEKTYSTAATRSAISAATQPQVTRAMAARRIYQIFVRIAL